MDLEVVRYSERPELWDTGMPGDYVFPAGLATVHIDRDHDLGEYGEPNIWIIHG